MHSLLAKIASFSEYWSISIEDLGMRIAEFSSSFRTSSLYFQSEIRDLQSEM
jgi:hypothetical protein